MKRILIFSLLLFSLGAYAGEKIPLLNEGAVPVSVVYESESAIRRGVSYLTGAQKPDGSWNSDSSATALAIMALRMNIKYGDADTDAALSKGRAYIISCVRPDGAIYSASSANLMKYSTAVCLAALAMSGNEASVREILQKGRAFLGSVPAQSQKVQDVPDSEGWLDDAMYLTESADVYEDEKPPAATPAVNGLALNNAIAFVKRVSPDKPGGKIAWVVAGSEGKSGTFEDRDPIDKYFVPASPVLRNYGSMTYDGLKSMIYAHLERNDPRVASTVEWASKHYTFDENPGMGAQGHYYYLQTFARAMSAYNQDVIVTDDGVRHNWRADLLMKLLQLQKGRGEWVNTNPRWMEQIPEISTSYALIAMAAALGNNLKISE